MKKYVISSCIALVAIVSLQAQDFKLSKNTGKLIINLSSVKVEGYSGSEIVFSSPKAEKDEDERAKGLRPINGSGYTDNTGLGISVVDKGTTVEVNQVSTKDGQVTIKVPKSMAISYAFNKVIGAGKAYFKNLEGELEIAVQYNNVELENITGPLTAKSIYGSIDAKFGETVKGPISVVSIYGHVDVAIPATTKANLSLKTSYGEILASSDLKIELEKTGSGSADMVSYSNNNVKGKMNGGGPEFALRADYSKIYLRKAVN
jgi:hypothetical protein